MRQELGQKKLQRIRDQTGLAIKYVLVRGNTDHRRDLYLENGRVAYLRRDGTIEDAETLNQMRGLQPLPDIAGSDQR